MRISEEFRRVLFRSDRTLLQGGIVRLQHCVEHSAPQRLVFGAVVKLARAGKALAVAAAADRLLELQPESLDRKSVVQGKSGSVRVVLGGRRTFKTKN